MALYSASHCFLESSLLADNIKMVFRGACDITDAGTPQLK